MRHFVCILIIPMMLNFSEFWVDPARAEVGSTVTNVFTLDTRPVPEIAHTGFALTNTFTLDTRSTPEPVHTGFALTNIFTLDTREDRRFALTNIFTLDTRIISLVMEETVRHEVPQEFRLVQNVPNPFNSQTLIRYALPTPQRVFLAIYDVMGQPVKVLVDRKQDAGWYSVIWDGRDRYDHEAASGIYFSGMKAGAFVEAKKILLLR
jgi:hypothetical protein